MSSHSVLIAEVLATEFSCSGGQKSSLLKWEKYPICSSFHIIWISKQCHTQSSAPVRNQERASSPLCQSPCPIHHQSLQTDHCLLSTICQALSRPLRQLSCCTNFRKASPCLPFLLPTTGKAIFLKDELSPFILVLAFPWLETVLDIHRWKEELFSCIHFLKMVSFLIG